MLNRNEKNLYNLSFKNNRNGEFIRVQSNSDGGHSTDYYHYFVRNADGALTKTRITSDVAQKLIDNVLLLGPSEGFILDNSVQAKKIDPSDIVHMKTSKEVNYTSTGDKLDFHWPIFRKLRETGYGSIIRATLTLHQVCASRCQFCSTINRNKKDSISLEEAKNFVKSLYFDQASLNADKFSDYNDQYKEVAGTDIRLKGLILSGGGQPNLWPHFTEFVMWLSELDIDLGLITNGFPKNIADEVYDNFKWIRLSITPEDASPFYPDGKFNKQYIPNNIIQNDKVAFGLSYVFGPWTNDDIINRIDQCIEPWNLAYVRFLTDCNLGRNEQLLAHDQLSIKLRELGLIDSNGYNSGKMFHQLKYHGTKEQALDLWEEGQCFLQAYNVFWDTTGHQDNGYSYLYPCDSVTVLSEDETGIQSARSFDGLKWGTVTNDRVSELFQKPLKPYFDPRKICSSCLFMGNNENVKKLINSPDYDSIATSNKPEHINFP
jgi:hypothetical protein